MQQTARSSPTACANASNTVTLASTRQQDGNFHAHVIRAVDQEEDGIGLHRHNEIEFQMVYILKGWMRFWYDGEGEVIAREGTCILQPPKVKHDVLEWSDDLELLEITSPADFTSEALQAAE